MFILFILAFFMGGALTLFAARANAMQAKGVFGMVSRETMLVANNILLAVSCLVVFVGTIWPLVAELFMGRKLSVGPPFFNMAFTPFMVVLALILPVGGIMPWKRGRLGRVLKQLRWAFVFALAVGALAWAMQTGRTALGPVGLFLGTWLIAGAAVDLWSRTGRRGSFARLWRLPRADWGKAVAHAGFGITILGISGLLAWEVEDVRVVKIGETFDVAGFDIRIDDVREVRGPNYFSTTGFVALEKDGVRISELKPEKRVYPVAGMPTTEAGIDNGFLRDVYVVLGDRQGDGSWAIRTFIKPLANWIWMGTIVMALGGILSLSDRRYRVAAGAAKVPQGVPAE